MDENIFPPRPLTRAERRRAERNLGRRLPPPNLKGTYTDSCIVCFRGADTGCAFRGEPEAIVAVFTVKLGMGQKEALRTLSIFTGCSPGMVPDEPEITIPVRLCESCASRADIKVGLAMPDGKVPLYRVGES